jgi:hypothetical protein
MSYVSVDDFKKYSGAHEDDTLIQNYIDSAENIVNNYLGYSPTLHNYTYFCLGNGTHELQLRARPINALITVEINDALLSDSDLYFPNDSEFIYYNKVFPLDSKIKVEYTAGYGAVIDDDAGNGMFLPQIIKMTVLRIASILQTESSGNVGVTSKSFADSGTRTFTNYTNFDKFLLPLSSYKLLVI